MKAPQLTDGSKHRPLLITSLPTLLLLGLFLLLLMIDLSIAPPLWWDEGWTLTVARNWVELGHYGRLLNGEPTSARLAAAFPVVAPIALSFRLLGVGIWQGRLPGVFLTLAALVLLYYLARRLYNRSIATATLAVLLIMPAHFHLHPALLGRQVLGEPAMFFYLLAGYACFLSAWRQPKWFMPLSVIFWGVALRTKAQVLPFWTVSLLVPLLMALLKRSWKAANLLGIGLLGSLVVSQLLGISQQLLLYAHTTPPGSAAPDVFDVTALVPVASIRLGALITTLKYGLPALLGLSYATWGFLKSWDNVYLDNGAEIVRVALLALAGSWLAWFILLSAGFVRYLAPTIFVGSIFVAALLHDLTDGFSLSCTFKRSALALRHVNRQNAAALLAILLIGWTVPATIRELYRFYVVYPSDSVQKVADFINSRTPPDALIETWNSELHFLLDRRYHYPPDEVHVALQRRKVRSEDVDIDYDPLAADPDYLVVGPPNHDGRTLSIYDLVGAMDAFRLLHTYSGGAFGGYDVYERIR